LRFAARVNWLGRLGLILAISATPIFGILYLAEATTGLVNLGEKVGISLFLLPHFGMLLFGVVAASSRALPRRNVLPLLVSLLPFVVVFRLRQAFGGIGPYYLLFAVFAVIGLGYALFGYVVYSDISQRETVVA